jgi:predicted dehydrogenase
MSALRVVVIGAGAHIFGAAHVPALAAAGIEVVGVHDANAALGRRVGEQHGWTAHDELAPLLAEPADAAVITAPHVFHAGIVLECLRAGLHVLVEKPVTVSVDGADTVVAEARARGLVVAVALQHRLRREVQEAKRLLEEGRIGELHRAEVVAYYPKRSLYYTGSPWRGTWKGEGGGILVNQGQHDLDLLVHLAGAPSRVFGLLRTRVQPIETEDTAEAVVEWPTGATGSIHVSSAALDGPPRLSLVGTAGVMHVVPGELHLIENETDVREFSAAHGDPFDRLATTTHPAFEGGGGDHTAVYRDFAAALREGRAPIAPVADAVGALELTNAITLSSHTGRPVELPLDRVGYRRLLDQLQHLHTVEPRTRQERPIDTADCMQ